MVRPPSPAEEDERRLTRERGDHEGMGYNRWRIDRMFLLVPAQVYVNRYIQSLVEFPPRQRPGSFNLVT